VTTNQSIFGPSPVAAVAPASRPGRVIGLIALGAACSLFLGYLAIYEDTWMNRVVSIGLLLPIAGLIFVLTRRARASLTIGIALLLVLAVLSRAKYDITTVSISVFDVALLDPGAIWFALNQEQFFWHKILGAAVLVLAIALILIDRPALMRLWKRLALFVAGTAVFAALAFAQEKGERSLLAMNGEIGQVSYFAKSLTHLPAFFGSSGFMTHTALTDPALPPPGTVFGSTACHTESKPPHIIVISDESSIDTTVQPGLTPDPVLAPFFASFDGVKRSMISESYGGATWLAETSVLTGLSTRAFGNFVPLVPRIIGSGTVRYNLPAWLKECGYRTLSLYPADGRFAGAAIMHASFGIDEFDDQAKMGITEERQRDRFYYQRVVDALAKDSQKPLFSFVWTTSNHFAWNFAFAPEMKIDGIPPSPSASIAEYRRRQRITQIDHQWLLETLRQRFPQERFIILRYGDHMPYMGMRMAAPDLAKEEAQARIAAFDQRFYTTYYAIDLVNMRPAAAPTPHSPLAAAYLGGELLSIAGLPLNPPLAYTRQMLERCKGQFADCADGTEMNRFNAWLMREGYVSGL
jgi:phosphoglycerol transferase MdoB-like AlkP superfamily enzyme